MASKKFKKITREEWQKLQSAIVDMQSDHVIIRDNGSEIYHLPDEAVTLYYHGVVEIYGKVDTIYRARTRLEDMSGIKLEEF